MSVRMLLSIGWNFKASEWWTYFLCSLKITDIKVHHVPTHPFRLCDLADFRDATSRTVRAKVEMRDLVGIFLYTVHALGGLAELPA